VFRNRISRTRSFRYKEGAAAALRTFLAHVEKIEPDDDQLGLAAEFETEAQAIGLDLDGGESQLLSILIRHSALLLLTGDKRAICAIEAVVERLGYSAHAAGKVGCFEQIILALVHRRGAETLHPQICREPGVDGALSLCFSCASGLLSPESILEGLVSFISHLRNAASCVLVASDDLSPMVP
jgi:hypothetical protein